MSEELKVDESTEVEPNLQVSVDPVVEQAKEQGWVPKEDWVAAGRDESEWRPAKEFVERGELFKSIHSTKRELKQTQAALTALQRHHQFVYERAYKEAFDDLRKEKRMAIREGDMERLEEVESEIEQLNQRAALDRNSMAAAQAAAAQAGPPPAFVNFVERNPWYAADPSLRDEADAIGFIYMNKGGDPQGLFPHVEKEMRRKFPEKFGVKKVAPNAVASVSREGKVSREAGVALTELETKIMNDLVKAGVMTKEQYIKELKGK